MSVEKIIYILSCRDLVSGQAFYVSGKLHCPVCHDDMPIRDVQVIEWRANCRQCTFARWAGMSEQTAEVFANGHVSRNPGHMVSVEREAHLAATKTKAKLDAWHATSHS
jgi:hypothetical protein